MAKQVSGTIFQRSPFRIIQFHPLVARIGDGSPNDQLCDDFWQKYQQVAMKPPDGHWASGWHELFTRIHPVSFTDIVPGLRVGCAHGGGLFSVTIVEYRQRLVQEDLERLFFMCIPYGG